MAIDYDLVLYVYNSLKKGYKPSVKLDKIMAMHEALENGQCTCDDEVLVSMIYAIVDYVNNNR